MAKSALKFEAPPEEDAPVAKVTQVFGQYNEFTLAWIDQVGACIINVMDATYTPLRRKEPTGERKD